MREYNLTALSVIYEQIRQVQMSSSHSIYEKMVFHIQKTCDIVEWVKYYNLVLLFAFIHLPRGQQKSVILNLKVASICFSFFFCNLQFPLEKRKIKSCSLFSNFLKIFFYLQLIIWKKERVEQFFFFLFFRGTQMNKWKSLVVA